MSVSIRVGSSDFNRFHRPHGTPALFGGKKLGTSSFGPTAEFLTDHYRDHPWILVRLASARREPLADLLEAGWRLVASKRDVAGYDATRSVARTRKGA